jgi:hypothetical protein
MLMNVIGLSTLMMSDDENFMRSLEQFVIIHNDFLLGQMCDAEPGPPQFSKLKDISSVSLSNVFCAFVSN